jgi:hypothetical protein
MRTPRLLAAEDKAWRDALESARAHLLTAAIVAVMAFVLLGVLRGWQWTDAIPLLAFPLFVYLQYAYKLTLYIRRPSRHKRWESRIIWSGHEVSLLTPIRFELRSKTGAQDFRGICCLVIDPAGFQSYAGHDYPAERRLSVHFNYPGLDFDSCPTSFLGPYEVFWYERLGRNQDWHEVVRDSEVISPA